MDRGLTVPSYKKRMTISIYRYKRKNFIEILDQEMRVSRYSITDPSFRKGLGYPHPLYCT